MKAMKKQIMTACLMLVSTFSFGWTGSESNQIARAQAFADGYSTNKFYSGLGYVFTTNLAFAACIDNILKDTPPINFVHEKMKIFPNTFTAACNVVRQEYPMFVGDDGFVFQKVNDSSFMLARSLAWLDLVSGGKILFDSARKQAIACSSRNVRRYLRAQGKSIVIGPDGVDPCKERLDGVLEALDAPRYNGLSNALERCGVSIFVPMVYRSAWSDDKITFETNAVFVGDVPFDGTRQWQFRFALGVKEYNKFVERYNGGSR